MKTAKIAVGIGLFFIGLALVISDETVQWETMLGCALAWVGVCITERGFMDVGIIRSKDRNRKL